MTQTAATPEMGVLCPSNCATAKATPRWRESNLPTSQLAEALILDALLSPTPPKTNGKLAIGSQCKHADSQIAHQRINVRCSVHLQMGLDERNISQKSAQHNDPLLGGKHICVPSSWPDTCIRVPQLCDTLQHFATSGPNPCPVLHLGSFHRGPGCERANASAVAMQRCVNRTDAMWVWSDDVNVVKESANPLHPL